MLATYWKDKEYMTNNGTLLAVTESKQSHGPTESGQAETLTLSQQTRLDIDYAACGVMPAWLEEM